MLCCSALCVLARLRCARAKSMKLQSGIPFGLVIGTITQTLWSESFHAAMGAASAARRTGSGSTKKKGK